MITVIFTRSSIAGFLKSILVIILLVSILSFLSLPVQNSISRTFERQADNFALQVTEDPDIHISLMGGLANSNLSNVSPHWYIRYFLYSHTTIMERTEAAKKFN
ncbi:MAG: M48 family metalloprotease [Clostridia bacterium]|nr:M48 family metalloprotease [Clostridia bacterium]